MMLRPKGGDTGLEREAQRCSNAADYQGWAAAGGWVIDGRARPYFTHPFGSLIKR
jgi:hypothetical protein